MLYYTGSQPVGNQSYQPNNLGPVAQSVEQWTHNPTVTRSIRVRTTNLRKNMLIALLSTFFGLLATVLVFTFTVALFIAFLPVIFVLFILGLIVAII